MNNKAVVFVSIQGTVGLGDIDDDNNNNDDGGSIINTQSRLFQPL